MRNLLFLLGILLLIPRAVFADVRLAVLEFRGVGVSDVLLQQLADEARTGIVQTSNGQKIKGEKFIIMTKENMMQILKDQGKDASCMEGECEIEIAKNIGADYVISGNLNKIDTLYALVIKLHSTSDSNLLSSESFKTESKKDLIIQTSNISSKVFQVGLKLTSSNNDSSSSGFSNSGGFSSSSGGFGGGVQGNLKQKLKEKKCREFAETEAKKLREERVDTEVKRLQSEATKAWNAMQEDFSTCLELDLEDRGPCQDALEGWYGNASTLKVVLNSGAEKVETGCGVREEVFDTISRTVEVAELEAAKQMREKLKRKSAAAGGGSGNGFDAVWIPAGSFTMGCTFPKENWNWCDDGEKPAHKVTLTKGFYMMTTEVTQGLYKDVMGSNPSRFSSCGAHCPVEMVNWYDAVRMANRLSERDGLEFCYQIGSGSKPSVSWKNKECTGWRLPTEAEWEYAARGGITWYQRWKQAREEYDARGGETADLEGAYVQCILNKMAGLNDKNAGRNNLEQVGWYEPNSGSKTHPVGQKKANGFGLYDMSGNVWEWVFDSSFREYGSSVTDPSYVDASSLDRVRRGGGWCANDWPIFGRYGADASDRNFCIGFRLLRTSKK